MQIFFFFFFFFCGKNVWKSVRYYMEVIEDILRYVKKTKISKSTDESFSTPKPKTICPYLKIAWLVRLVPCFVGVHHIFVQKWDLLESGLISKAVKTYFDRKAVKTRLKPVKTGLNRSKRGQNLQLRNTCQGLWKNPVRWIYICPSVMCMTCVFGRLKT